VTRGQLPQRAGSLGLNGGGTAAAVPPSQTKLKSVKELKKESLKLDSSRKPTSPCYSNTTLCRWNIRKHIYGENL